MPQTGLNESDTLFIQLRTAVAAAPSMRAVAHLVVFVLSVSTPSKIGGAVVGRVAIKVAALQPFRDFDINMTMIHSRPFRGRAWEYLFFIDFQGHMEDGGPAKALGALKELCPMLKVLGSYPAAD